MLRYLSTSLAISILMFVMSVSVFVPQAFAQPTPTINYQGKLTDNTGVAVADGTYNMRFYLYNAVGVATTSNIWEEVLTGADKVQVTNGLFSVMLGSTTALTGVDFNQALYLGVEIGGSTTPAWDGEMSPRKGLGTVPAAFESYQLGGVASSSFLRSDSDDTASGLLTFTGGLLSTASSTITNFNFNTATGTNLVLNGESFSDLTGTGLINTSGTLSVSSSSLNISLEGLTDVSSMTETYGDLLYWNGSAWADIATSSLGLGDGSFLGLGDTPGSFTSSAIPYVSGSALAFDSTFVYDGTNLGIGTSSPNAMLTVVGSGGQTDNLFSLASSTIGFGGLTGYAQGLYSSVDYLGGTTITGRVLNPTMVGNWDPNDTNIMQDAEAVKIQGDYAYVAGWSSKNLAVVDISDPSNPTTIGNWDPNDNNIMDGSEAVDVVGNYAYVTGFNSNNMAIVDISDPANPATIGNWDPNDTNIMDGGYTVTVSGNYAYVGGYTSDNMAIVDISDPANPATIGNWDPNDPNVMNETYGISISGNYAYVVGQASDNMVIVDVSDPVNPQTIYNYDPNDANILNGPEDIEISGKYAYIPSTGSANLIILDISDSTNPTLTANWDPNDVGLMSGPTGVSVSGNYAYLVSYTSSNVVVVDISSSTNPTTVANWDLDNISVFQNGISIDVSGGTVVAVGASSYNAVILDVTALDVANIYAGNIRVDELEVDQTASFNEDINVRGSASIGQNLFANNGSFSKLSVTGDLEVANGLYNAGISWDSHSLPETNNWKSVAYGNGRFVAVSADGVNRVMYSDDGKNWATTSAAEANSWQAITYGNGLFVAVSDDGTNRVMTSPDGVNWSAHVSAEQNDWVSVAYGNGMFVAVAFQTGTNKIMTSYDGYNWTSQSAPVTDFWKNVIFGNNEFVATCSDTSSYVECSNVMSSSDGVTWTAHSLGDTAYWSNISYGDGVYVVSGGNRSMISNDLLTWSTSTHSGITINSAAYGQGLFVGFSNTYDGVVTSPDGINWTPRAVSGSPDLIGGIYGDGLFVGIYDNEGSSDTFYTSGQSIKNIAFDNNTYQGGISVYGQFNIGTTTSNSNILNIASTTGTSLLTMTNGGNVGIGTTSPNARLSIENLAFSGAGVVGLDQYLQTENSVDTALQYGNRFYLHASNTATTTIVGSMYRIQDDSEFENTVRGLEVQANQGINTNGENTALSGFARTFGVRGVTNGDAGGSFEPAGGFFETEGTTQGNAIRGYSDSITTATLLSLFHDTSSFEGTGLEMNFGNTTGDFASTTSKYLDFQNAGNSVFTVSAFGTTTIGDGTTNNLAGLQIGYGGICVDNDGSCTASTSGRITSVESQTGNSDLAEMYFSSTNLEAGEIVVLEGGLSIDLATKDSDTPIIGVVSTKPGLTLGYDDKSLNENEIGYPVALSGRVPIKLSTENGPIHKGDQLMLSSIPGVAMKAKGTGTTIGTALEDFDDTRMYSDTYVNQFGDDMVDPVFEPIFTNADPRINDGCYYSGGSAAGEEPCVPLVSTSTNAQLEEANNLVEEESVEEALDELRDEDSDTEYLADGTEVRVGQIIMFVRLGHRWADESQLASLGVLVGTSSIDSIGDNEEETVFDRLVALANNFVDGVLSVFELKVNRVEIAEELCVDGVCLNANDLRTILDAQAEEVSSNGSEEPVEEDDAEDTNDDSGSVSEDGSDVGESEDNSDTNTSNNNEEDGENSDTATSTSTTTNPVESDNDEESSDQDVGNNESDENENGTTTESVATEGGSEDEELLSEGTEGDVENQGNPEEVEDEPVVENENEIEDNDESQTDDVEETAVIDEPDIEDDTSTTSP